jgi:DNA repair protein RadA/Sms
MEPAVDLGIALALASSLRNIPLPDSMAALGEIGLGGELRNISQLPRRLAELKQMGFNSCIGPTLAFQSLEAAPGMKTIEAKTLTEGLSSAFPSRLRRNTVNKDII